MVAADGKLDRFDGEENHEYFEDIRKFMAKTFRAWDCKPHSPDFLQASSPTLKQDFDRKFPFAVQRFGHTTWSYKEKENRTQNARGQVKKVNTPAKEQLNPNLVGGMVASTAKRQPRVDPQRSEEELRLAKVKYSHIN